MGGDYRGSMANIRGMNPDVADRPVLVSFSEYSQAQAAVDKLSDNKFPVQHVAIVGVDLTLVESVLGRTSWGRAALNGMATFAWFGVLSVCSSVSSAPRTLPPPGWSCWGCSWGPRSASSSVSCLMRSPVGAVTSCPVRHSKLTATTCVATRSSSARRARSSDLLPPGRPHHRNEARTRPPATPTSRRHERRSALPALWCRTAGTHSHA